MLNKSKFLALSAISIALAGCGSDDAGNQLGSLTLSGEATAGETLSTLVFDADGIDESTLIYSWFADGTVIDGATLPTYTLTENEVGTEVFASVVYTDNGGLVESHSTDSSDTVAPVPEIFAGLTSSIVNSSATVTGTITLADGTEASLIAVTDQATSFGTFTLSETGAYTYTLNTEDPTIVALGADDSVTDSIVFEATDGEVDVLIVTISGVEEAVEVEINQAASVTDVAGGDSPNDTGELRYSFDAPILEGRVVVEMFREAETNDGLDGFIAVLGTSGSSDESFADIRLDTSAGNYRLRDDLTDTDIRFDGFALETLIQMEIVWDATAASDTVAPIVSVTIDGEAAFSSPFSSFSDNLANVIDGAGGIQFRVADGDDVTEFGLIVDNLTVYSSDSGTEEVVFSDDFESYEVGESLDPDAATNDTLAIVGAVVADPTPYSSSSFSANIVEFEEGTPAGSTGGSTGGDAGGDDAGGDDAGGDDAGGDDGVAGIPGTPGNQFASITDTLGDDTGELRYALFDGDTLAAIEAGTASGMAQGRVEVTFRRLDDDLGDTDAFIDLYNVDTNNAGAILDLRIRDNNFEVRSPETDISTDLIVPALDVFQTAIITFEYPNGDTGLLPTVSLEIGGTDLGDFATDNDALGGLTHVAFRFGSNGNVSAATGVFSVDNIAIYSDVAGTDLIFSDNFDGVADGTDLDPDNNPDSVYNSATSEAVVDTEQ